jgi:hypothetical protein
MARILGLPKVRYPFTQQNDILRDLVHGKIAVSFRFVEKEVVPLLQQILTSIDRAAEESKSGAWGHGIPDGTSDSLEKAVSLAHKLQALVECYRDILIPESHDADQASRSGPESHVATEPQPKGVTHEGINGACHKRNYLGRTKRMLSQTSSAMISGIKNLKDKGPKPTAPE